MSLEGTWSMPKRYQSASPKPCIIAISCQREARVGQHARFHLKTLNPYQFCHFQKKPQTISRTVIFRKLAGPVRMYLPLGMRQHMEAPGAFGNVWRSKFWSLAGSSQIGISWILQGYSKVNKSRYGKMLSEDKPPLGSLPNSPWETFP